MEFINFGRPTAFTEYAAKAFLEAYGIVNERLREQGRCNQYGVAIELKRLFDETKLQKTDNKKTSTQKKVELCNFLNIEYHLDSERAIRQFNDNYNFPTYKGLDSPWFYSDTYNQLEIYILSASSLAIVQMKKRIKRYFLQNIY